jgi:hypothetical protein
LPRDENLSQATPEVRHDLASKVDQCAASVQKALELEDLLHQNFVKLNEHQLNAVESKLSTLRRQLASHVCFDFHVALINSYFLGEQ